MATQSVRINKKILARIKKQVKTSRQPISAFIDIALDCKLTQLEQEGEVSLDLLQSKKTPK
jgi:hypothetical protein